MKHSIFILEIIVLLIFIGHTNGQDTPYIIDEEKRVFSTIEKDLTQGELEKVLTSCDKIIETTTNQKIKGIAWFYKGQVEVLLFGERPFSVAYQNAFEIFEKIGFEKGLALVYGKIADLNFFQLEYSKADSLYSLSMALSKKLNLYEPLYDAYEKKGNIHAFYRNVDSATVYLKKALALAPLANDPNQVVGLYNQISTIYHASGQLDSAIFYFEKLLDIKNEKNDLDGLISDYSALGNLFRERGDYEKAQMSLLEALKIAEAERDTLSIITIFTELGDVQAAQNILDSAEKYYLQALTIAQLKDRPFSEASCYKKIGNLFLAQNKKEAAMENYEAALELYEHLNNKTNVADVLIQMSETYERGSEYTKAKEMLLDALAVRKNSQDLMSTLTVKQSLAEIEIKNGSVRRGIAYAEECLSSYLKMDDKEGLKNVYKLLAEAQYKVGDYRNAYRFQQLYHSVSDSLTSIERSKAIKELDARYNTEKKDKEIALQNEKIRTQQVEILKKNNQLLMLAGGLALFGLLASFVFFIYLKNKQINKQKIEVLKKEKETEHLRSVIEGEEKERKRFARELHDGLGAMLATVKMQINGMKRKIPEVEGLPTYQKAESLIDDACRSVREISHGLMPYVLEQQGLFFAIEDMCQSLTIQQKTEFDFISYGDENHLSDIVQITLFRVVQELLKNIVNHAEAKEVIVQLTIEENEAMLVVEDDGKGFDVSAERKGIGLDNIRSRINYLKGNLDIISTYGQGSTFTIQLPISKDKI